MKIKEGYVLREVADQYVVIPFGSESVSFNGMITLNESGALLWRALENGGDRETLADALVGEYDIDRESALADADEFIASLTKIGCIE